MIIEQSGQRFASGCGPVETASQNNRCSDRTDSYHHNPCILTERPGHACDRQVLCSMALSKAVQSMRMGKTVNDYRVDGRRIVAIDP